VLLSLVYAETWVQQVRPIDEEMQNKILDPQESADTEQTEIQWPLLNEAKIKWAKKELEIEPNESDQIHFDFLIDSNVKTIVAYSYFRNAEKFGVRRS